MLATFVNQDRKPFAFFMALSFSFQRKKKTCGMSMRLLWTAIVSGLTDQSFWSGVRHPCGPSFQSPSLPLKN